MRANLIRSPFTLTRRRRSSSVLEGSAASGWQSSAILVRLAVDAYANRSAALGSNGIDEVKWLKPVYAGETLTGRVTVLSSGVSASKPEIGVLKMHVRTAQHGGRDRRSR